MTRRVVGQRFIPGGRIRRRQRCRREGTGEYCYRDIYQDGTCSRLIRNGGLAMCHEYGMRWLRSERSERKPSEEPKRDLKEIFAVPPGKAVAPAVAELEKKEPARQEKELASAK